MPLEHNVIDLLFSKYIVDMLVLKDSSAFNYSDDGVEGCSDGSGDWLGLLLLVLFLSATGIE